MRHPSAPGAAVRVSDVSKSFILHNQSSARLPIIYGAAFEVDGGECVALTGPSGAGKSTMLRMVYGNYLVDAGQIEVLGTDVPRASAREMLALRRARLGYVSQFLRVVPRVSTLEVVAEPCLAVGLERDEALERARILLRRLNIPEQLWGLSPLTFSGGEQQRVNIARGFSHRYPVLLLDEPTASLDPANREVVLSMILEAKAGGGAILGIFHDATARAAVCDRAVDVTAFVPQEGQ
ncbi:MAG: phosphonate C-P lyase system protein PhnL [Pseudomonadota bacterium]